MKKTPAEVLNETKKSISNVLESETKKVVIGQVITSDDGDLGDTAAGYWNGTGNYREPDEYPEGGVEDKIMHAVSKSPENFYQAHMDPSVDPQVGDSLWALWTDSHSRGFRCTISREKPKKPKASEESESWVTRVKWVG